MEDPLITKLEEELDGAAPYVAGYGDVIKVTMHAYPEQLRKLFEIMAGDYRLVTVIKVPHCYCSETGREFWFQVDYSVVP